VSLTVLLSTAIGGLILLSVGTVLFITAGANFRNTFELLRDSGELTMSGLETSVRAYVDPAEDLADHMVRLVDKGLIDVADKQQLKDTLFGALGPSPQISGVVIWDSQRRPVIVLEEADGSMQTSEPSIADDQGPTEATAPPLPTWSEPVSIDGATYINMQTALHHGGQYVGAFATGIDTTRLSALVRQIGRELGMTAFILYGDNHVLAHPQMLPVTANIVPEPDPSLDLKTLEEFGDPVLAAYPEREQDMPGGSENFENSIVEIGDEGYLFLTKEITGYSPQPWRIGVYTNLEDVSDQFRRLLGSTVVGFVILLVAIFLGYLLAKYLARPIIKLSKAEGQVGDLDLENIEIPKASFIREINDQIAAFHRMLDGLRTFETYVPKALVQRIISQGGSGEVVSSESNLTLMFTDIIGFTKMSENREPGEVARLLNEHFAIVNACIEEEGGTIDKYIGDAVMAFWGAPDEQADHAARACRAGLEIQKRMEQANRAATDDPKLRVKISIHCGPLIVGNIGAPGRINYTVVGDTVNTCSRIEDLCDGVDDGTSAAIILVSEQVVAETGGGFQFEPAGSFQVKGKSKSVNVFKLAGESDPDATSAESTASASSAE
jgi:adenylate cyclase